MRTLIAWIRFSVIASLLAAAPAFAANLVTVDWLQKNLGSDELVLIDATGTKAYATKHIPGAVGVDLWRYGLPTQTTPADMQKRVQSWGIDRDKKVVVYDEGGGQMAPWMFYELYYWGFPAGNLFILDGGLAKWEASGGAVTKEPTLAKTGNFQVTTTREDARVRLNEFMAATGDKSKHAVVEALEPTYHYGGTQWFSLAGHVPNALMMPTADFYNADKTFKSPEEIRRMASYLGIKPEQEIESHCGGGIAATVPFFALRFVSGYPNVRVYRESQLEWLQDERGLPMWTYDAPNMKREAPWLNSWNAPMMRMYGVAKLNVIDVRSPEAYQQGHVPFAVNIPADVFRSGLDDPKKLASILGPAGVNPAWEAVIVSNGGVNESSALAYLALEKAGQKKISVLMDSVDDFGLRGFQLAKEPTIVGAPKSPQELAVRPAVYNPSVRGDLTVANANDTKGIYPKVFIASGKSVPVKSPGGKVVHVPYTDLVNANGTPRPAAEIWNILAKAGVPRYAEIIVFADEPGAAAVNYFVMKLMGFPDVKVLL
jgi:3-mercaptopyruvate sulfurtransferase SseA